MEILNYYPQEITLTANFFIGALLILLNHGLVEFGLRIGLHRIRKPSGGWVRPARKPSGGKVWRVGPFRPSRIQMVDPKPIPEEELRRTYEWMRGWDMLDDVGEDSLVDAIRQSQAHGAAAE